ncbi:hypothetical protein B0H15DRAFT_815178 [Mycena belliarum]|uniref:Secreted protein n=1 Tax=Mycena belliarum TaxID=1033014 RepID=A0AAD6Y1B7_9AGAR|nr:hypothetical protein B0H15DRAFT_815178 [Mycena belliae]
MTGCTYLSLFSFVYLTFFTQVHSIDVVYNKSWHLQRVGISEKSGQTETEENQCTSGFIRTYTERSVFDEVVHSGVASCLSLETMKLLTASSQMRDTAHIAHPNMW